MSWRVQCRNDRYPIKVSQGNDLIHIALRQCPLRNDVAQIIAHRSIRPSQRHVIQRKTEAFVVGKIKIKRIHLVPGHVLDHRFQCVHIIEPPSAVQIDAALLDIRIILNRTAFHGSHVLRIDIHRILDSGSAFRRDDDVVFRDIHLIGLLRIRAIIGHIAETDHDIAVSHIFLRAIDDIHDISGMDALRSALACCQLQGIRNVAFRRRIAHIVDP